MDIRGNRLVLSACFRESQLHLEQPHSSLDHARREDRLLLHLCQAKHVFPREDLLRGLFIDSSIVHVEERDPPILHCEDEVRRLRLPVAPLDATERPLDGSALEFSLVLLLLVQDEQVPVLDSTVQDYKLVDLQRGLDSVALAGEDQSLLEVLVEDHRFLVPPLHHHVSAASLKESPDVHLRSCLSPEWSSNDISHLNDPVFVKSEQDLLLSLVLFVLLVLLLVQFLREFRQNALLEPFLHVSHLDQDLRLESLPQGVLRVHEVLDALLQVRHSVVLLLLHGVEGVLDGVDQSPRLLQQLVLALHLLQQVLVDRLLVFLCPNQLLLFLVVPEMQTCLHNDEVGTHLVGLVQTERVLLLHLLQLLIQGDHSVGAHLCIAVPRLRHHVLQLHHELLHGFLSGPCLLRCCE